MSADLSWEMFDARFRANCRLSGSEFHYCCPFCAAPDWLVCNYEEIGRDTGPMFCPERGCSAWL